MLLIIELPKNEAKTDRNGDKVIEKFKYFSENCKNKEKNTSKNRFTLFRYQN